MKTKGKANNTVRKRAPSDDQRVDQIGQNRPLTVSSTTSREETRGISVRTLVIYSAGGNSCLVYMIYTKL